MPSHRDSTSSEEEYPPLLGSRLPRTASAHSNGVAISKPGNHVEFLEPMDAYKSRWTSIRIMYLTMFLGSVTFTITVSSLWPFLQVLNPDDTASFLGWVVAAYSLGQLIASPFFGFWYNFRKNSREPLVTSLFLTVAFNVMYMYLQSIPQHPDAYMIVARGLIGFSAGNVAVVRAYLSAATTLKERTACLANVSIFQAMGFVLGPVIQACLVPIGFPGPVEAEGLHLNMYTAPALFASALALVNFFLVLFVFKEYNIAALESATDSAKQLQKEDYEEDTLDASGSFDVSHRANGHTTKLLDDDDDEDTSHPDYIAIASTIFISFVILFIFTVFETIGTALTMHMYAWSKSDATLYQGIILGGASIVSIFVVAVVKVMAKRINERYILLTGFIICFFGFVLFVPMGSKLPPISIASLTNGTVKEPHSSLALYVLPDNLLNDRANNEEAISHGAQTTRNFGHDTTSSLKQHHAISRRHADAGRDILCFIKETLQDGTSSEVDISYLAVDPERYKAGIYIPANKSQPNPATAERRPSKGSGHNYTNTNETSTRFNFNTTFHDRNTDAAVDTTDTSRPVDAEQSSTTAPYSTTSVIRPTDNGNSSVSPEGCPWQYDWCQHVPMLPLAQYLAATFVISLGYPMCQMITNAIYSKILGPKPQGIWMGWLTAAGCLSRTVGPIYVTQIYDSYGPQITFGSVAGLVFVAIIFVIAVFKKLVPYKGQEDEKEYSVSQDARHAA